MRWHRFGSKPMSYEEKKHKEEQELLRLEAMKDKLRREQEWHRFQKEKKETERELKRLEYEKSKRKKLKEEAERLRKASIPYIKSGGKFLWTTAKRYRRKHRRRYRRKHRRRYRKPRYSVARYLP